MALSKFQVSFHDFVQSTSKYCKHFSQDYLHGKSMQILETDFEIISEILEFLQENSNFVFMILVKAQLT